MGECKVVEFFVGQEATLAVQVDVDAISRFVALSGDYAPIHIDPAFAKTAGYDDVLVHGAYLAALFSRFLGMELPGSQAVLERLDVTFRKPCYAPTSLLVRGVVAQVSDAVSSIVLRLTIERAVDDIVATARSWHHIIGREGNET